MDASKYTILANSTIGFEITFVTQIKDDDTLINAVSKISPDLISKRQNGKYAIIMSNQLPYASGVFALAKTLEYVKSEGSTDDRCGINIYISFVKGFADLYKLNVCKFILNFNEDITFSLFPDCKNSIGAKSIKYMIPNTIPDSSISILNLYDNLRTNDNNLYGINFSRLKDNMLVFQYIKCKGFESEYQKICYLTDYYIVNAYNSLMNPDYNSDDMEKINKISKKYNKLVDAFTSYDNFKQYFKNITFKIDLDDPEYKVNAIWPMMKDKLYDIILNTVFFSKDNKMSINYDTDESSFEIKDAKIKNCYNLLNTVVVSSEVSGNFNGCSFYETEITDSILNNCGVLAMSSAKNSILNNSFLEEDAELERCQVNGDSTVCGKCKECDLINTKFTEDANLVKCTKKDAIKI